MPTCAVSSGPCRSAARALLCSGVVLAGGCGGLPRLSEGHIGCPADEITVRDEQNHFGSTSWTAECRGVRYLCSSTTGLQDSQVACAPEVPAVAAGSAGAEVGGCQFDMQCKGERLCRAGRCVDP